MKLRKCEKVRIARVIRGYSQAYVAMKIGIKQQAYRKIEDGTTILTQDRFEKIAEILGMKPEKIQNIENIIALLN